MALENFILDITWLRYCFNADSFFPDQWTEEPKKKSSDHLAGFASSKSCLSVSTDWVEVILQQVQEAWIYFLFLHFGWNCDV